jgi:hypothetical protein
MSTTADNCRALGCHATADAMDKIDALGKLASLNSSQIVAFTTRACTELPAPTGDAAADLLIAQIAQMRRNTEAATAQMRTLSDHLLGSASGSDARAKGPASAGTLGLGGAPEMNWTEQAKADVMQAEQDDIDEHNAWFDQMRQLEEADFLTGNSAHRYQNQHETQ